MPVYPNAVAQPRAELTSILMESAGTDEQFIGLKLFPELGVSAVSIHAPVIKIAEGNLMRATTKERAPGTNFQRWHSSISDYAGTLLQRAEEVQIPDETTLSWDNYFNVEAAYTKEAGDRLRRGHEIESANTLFNPSNFPVIDSLVDYTKTLRTTNSFVDDMENLIRSGLSRGNRFDTLVIPGPVYTQLRMSAPVQNFINGTLGAGRSVNENTIREAFADRGLKNVFIADAYVNNSDDGKSDMIEPIWGNDYIFFGKLGSGDLESGGFGRTFFWDKEGPIFNVSTYRDEPKKSNIIRGMRTTKVAAMNATAGVLLDVDYSLA